MPNAASPRRVLVAGVSTRALGESAARAGYAVTSLDAFGDLDQHPGVRALSLPRDLGVEFNALRAARAAQNIYTDVVAYLAPFENHPSAIDALATGRALWGNSASVVRSARDPGTLSRQGDVSALGCARWLVKPRASGGGHGIRWWTPGDAVPAGSYVQPYVEGLSSSIVFVAARGHTVPFGITTQLIGDGTFGATGFRYCGNLLVDPSGASARAAMRLAECAARELDLVGVNCLDYITRADGTVVPIELNPRWSASMELAERAYGLSVFGAHASACSLGRLPDFELAEAAHRRPSHGKAVLFARHDIVCGDTTPWLDDDTVRDVPHPDEHIPAGRPVCTVFAHASTPDACYAALARRAERMYETLDSWSSVAA
jgi:predicted ATP-grasp superfamily ATP-dependent carboligase